jgi:hypothetical protein
MGERMVMQEALFYSFGLEQHVPADHLLRSIGRFVDLSGVRQHLRPYYSETGRPSIDPELLMTTVARCMAEGLIGGECFVADAGMIKADANRQRSVPGSDGPSVGAAGHAVREYLEVLDDAVFGAATPIMPKFISVADPASRWTGANGGLVFFACCTNYLIDLKHAMIMDVEATTAVRQVEVTAQRIMLDRTQKRFGLWPERLAADSGHGDAANLVWLVHERGIEPRIPVFEKNRTDGS